MSAIWGTEDLAAPAEGLVRVIQQGLAVSRHIDLMLWLQGEVQHFLPHDILLACWGGFGDAGFHIDVISQLPSIRTTTVMERNVEPMVRSLHERWQHSGKGALVMSLPTGIEVARTGEDCRIAEAFGAMRTVMVHGLRDQRGRQDCFYIALSRLPQLPATTHQNFAVLLPYLDTALRSVTHLPVQYLGPGPVAADRAPIDSALAALGLSERETEIMRWVCAGKTNQEIGLILHISAFTVKNHLKRIFKKLDVRNRAQAVARLGSLCAPGGSTL